MSTAEVIQVESVIPENLSDAQMDKFFASGGKEDTLIAEENVIEEESTEDTPLVEPAAPTPEAASLKEQAENNYKTMAHEERLRRQEVQQELQENKLRVQKMEEAFQKMIELQNPKQPEPSFDENPLEALRIKQERLEQYANQQQILSQQRAQYERIQQSQNQFLNQYHNDAAQFAGQTPDFKEAYQHLVNSRINEYKAAGYDDKQAHQLLIEDEMAIASKSYSDGINPAQRMYELAKIRGYQGKTVESAPAKPNDAQKLEQFNKSLEASKSLSGSAGGKVDKAFTLESLAEMDDDDFDKNWAKLMKK